MKPGFYAQPIWTCDMCGQRGPWVLSCWWRDGSGRYEVPAGQTVYLPETVRMAKACSKPCAKRWARAVGSDRISITRPERDDWHIDQSIAWVKQQQRQRHTGRMNRASTAGDPRRGSGGRRLAPVRTDEPRRIGNP